MLVRSWPGVKSAQLFGRICSWTVHLGSRVGLEKLLTDSKGGIGTPAAGHPLRFMCHSHTPIRYGRKLEVVGCARDADSPTMRLDQ